MISVTTKKCQSQKELKLVLALVLCAKYEDQFLNTFSLLWILALWRALNSLLCSHGELVKRMKCIDKFMKKNIAKKEMSTSNIYLPNLLTDLIFYEWNTLRLNKLLY